MGAHEESLSSSHFFSSQEIVNCHLLAENKGVDVPVVRNETDEEQDRQEVFMFGMKRHDH